MLPRGFAESMNSMYALGREAPKLVRAAIINRFRREASTKNNSP